MSTTVIIGNKSFEIPDPGETEGWGEDTTDYLIAIADALTTVQGPNDILQTTAPIANNVTTPTPISGFAFSTANVLSISSEYFITRTFDNGTSTVAESGTIIGSFDGSEFTISVESEGETGVEFDITNTGQVTYTSSDLTDYTTGSINFTAKTLDQP